MSRIEEIQGHRWAVDICQTNLTKMLGGKAALLKVLERGLIEKPAGYQRGVQRIIELVEAQPDEQAGQVHKGCEG